MADSVFIVVAPYNAFIILYTGVNAFITDDRNLKYVGCFTDVPVQLFGKRVRCVYQQRDVLFTAERLQTIFIHATLQADAVMQRNFLFIALG